MTFEDIETVIRLHAKLDAEGGDGELAAFVEEFDRLRAALQQHATTLQYTNPFDDVPPDLYMCKICGTGDAHEPSEIGHADGCLLASVSAPPNPEQENNV